MCDLINGLFETFAPFFIIPSIVKLHRDKRVQGISLVHVLFFYAWNYWNLYYYPSLNQWLSFYGGIGIIAVNTVWIGQMIYWKKPCRFSGHDFGRSGICNCGMTDEEWARKVHSRNGIV